MKIKICLATILLFLYSVQIVFAQRKSTMGGVVNGKAIYLPEPDYPQEAKDFCAGGQVNVLVLIGEDGNVISAKAILDDELLRNSAVKATMKAKFNTNHVRVKVRGIVVYNFVLKKKCIEAGIVNKKAIYLPKPIYPKSCRCAGNATVQIVIDQNGNVTTARGISGHPLLQFSALASARKARFSPTFVDGEN